MRSLWKSSFRLDKTTTFNKTFQTLTETHDCEAAAFRVLGGPLLASIGLGISEMLQEAKDSRHARISNRKYSGLAV